MRAATQQADNQREIIMTYQADLHENIAAISGELWGGKSKFYDRHGADLSGFPGVWRFSIDAARIFTNAEKKFGKKYGNKPNASFEYLDAILPYAEWLRDSKELPTQTEQEAKAWELILAAASIKKG